MMADFDECRTTTHPQWDQAPKISDQLWRMNNCCRKPILSLLLLLLVLHWRQQHVLLLTSSDRMPHPCGLRHSQLDTSNMWCNKNEQQPCASLNQVLRLIRHDNYTRVLPMLLLVAIMPWTCSDCTTATAASCCNSNSNGNCNSTSNALKWQFHLVPSGPAAEVVQPIWP